MEEVRVPVFIEWASYDARNAMLTISFRMTGRDAMRASEAFRRAYSCHISPTMWQRASLSRWQTNMHVLNQRLCAFGC